MKYLADPSKLASKLDWSKASGSILALDVGHDKIGLAIASHPSFGESPLALEPMPIRLETRQGNRRALAESVIRDLKKVVESHNVVGFVFSWPLQKEGRCGAPCGKVLHTLDSLVEESTIVSSKRPFCLWDDHHYLPKEDDWGRAPQYGVTTTKTLHKASEEQYVHRCSSSIAVEVWNDYCSKQWPTLNGQDDDEEDEDDIWQVKSSDRRRSESNTVATSDEWLDSDDDSYTDMVLFARS